MSGQRKVQIEIDTIPNDWLHSARSLKVAGINAFFIIPVLVLLFLPRMTTLYLLIATIVVLTILEKFGYTPTVAFRMARAFMAGKRVNRNRRIGRMRIWK